MQGDVFLVKRFLVLLILIIFYIISCISCIAEPQIDGRSVFFGHYEQDNNEENGPEPIEWLVLTADDDILWLLSRYGLAPSWFHPTKEAVHWSRCKLRKKLNEDFYFSAFSDFEREAILLTHVTADKNFKFHNSSGKDTDDYVYLLSTEEVFAFFPEQNDRLAWPTQSAIAANCVVDKKNNTGCCGWWTRTSGLHDGDASRISTEGIYNHFQVNYRRDCIRPVIRIDIKKSGLDFN